MTDVLVLDALNPPDPDSLVSDLKSVGAVAVGIYVLRRDASGGLLSNGDWTADHVAKCLANNIGVFGIIVPGNNPLDTDPQTAMATAVNVFHLPVGVLTIDLETFSEPNPAWVQGCITELSNNKWFVVEYGDITLLHTYPVANGDWVSHGFIPVRENQLFPVPALPVVDGLIGDQYTVGVVINGHSYDGSVFDSSVVNRMGVNVDMALTAQQDQALARILTGFADGVQSATYDGQTPMTGPNFVPDTLNGLAKTLTDIQTQLTTLQTAVDKLTPPGTPSLVPHDHPQTGTTGPATAT